MEFLVVVALVVLMFVVVIEYTLYVETLKIIEIQKQRNLIFKNISVTLNDRLEYQKSKDIRPRINKPEVTGHERN